jgi:hypothetical protein
VGWQLLHDLHLHRLFGDEKQFGDVTIPASSRDMREHLRPPFALESSGITSPSREY